MKQIENEIKYAAARAFLERLLAQGQISQTEFDIAERHAARKLGVKTAVRL